MQSHRRPLLGLCALMAGLPLIVGCAPVFSEMQSAKLAGTGRAEVTGSGSMLYWNGPSSEDDSGHVEDHVGLQVATGLHDRVDLRLRYERVVDPGVNVLGFGPKVGLVRDHLALYVPVGFAFGKDIDSGKAWEMDPTLIGTIPLGTKAEFNASGKVMIPLGRADRDTLVAFNTGFGLSTNLRKWVLRPEVGFCFNPGEEGHYTHYSLAVSFFFGKTVSSDASGADPAQHHRP
jgi:hypothetical protein